MTSQELRTLRFQLLLMGGLIGGCIVAAAVTASQRTFFERFLKEKYQPIPASLSDVADEAAEGRVDAKKFRELDRLQRLALYDDWMMQTAPSSDEPGALLAADCELYLGRVERTLVCGSAEQRARALEFLEKARCCEARDMLQHAADWAKRGNQPELAAQIAETIQRLPPPALETPESDATTKEPTGSPTPQH